MASDAVTFFPLRVAVRTADTLVATASVETETAALVFPAVIVTLDGSDAAELPLFRATVTPPVGAFAVRVTVPVAEFPPTTLVGDTVIDFSACAELIDAKARVSIRPSRGRRQRPSFISQKYTV